MYTSKFLLSTLKESPSDAVVISHQLMLRAGMIRKLAAGLYTWMPIGLRTLRKVEHIVREEMDKAGAQEILMPVVQPSELWQESGRWQKYGGELLRLQDRHNRDFCFGPTHEEVITDLARNELSSYKQLPMSFYQIQLKFRDETRPRFGVMRAREFTMKDAYSFHATHECLQATYDIMHSAYHAIFSRLNLNFRAVEADSGSIGGDASHEFHVLAQSGEDDIAFSNSSEYAANIELAPCLAPTGDRPSATKNLEHVSTPSQKSIAEITAFLKVPAEQTVKTLIVEGEQPEDAANDAKAPLMALVLRGDHELNELKAEKLAGIASPLRLANDEQIQTELNCSTGFIGPVSLGIPVIVDQAAAHLADFVCGANKEGEHCTGVNWDRDCGEIQVADLRNILAGDPSPDGQGTIEIKRGIEVGHIFQLGKAYSTALNATVLDQNGKTQTMTMGCYGIGISRVVAAAIEQNHDDKGITWPDVLAPFHVAIVPMNAHKSPEVLALATKLHDELEAQGIEVLVDDRDKKTSPGVKFADMELIGIPHRVVISDRGLKQDMVEYKHRRDADSQDIASNNILNFLLETVKR